MNLAASLHRAALTGHVIFERYRHYKLDIGPGRELAQYLAPLPFALYKRLFYCHQQGWHVGLARHPANEATMRRGC